MNTAYVKFLSELTAYILENDTFFSKSEVITEINDLFDHTDLEDRLAALRMTVGTYGRYFFDSVLLSYDNQKVISQELQNSLVVVREIFQKFHDLDKWNTLHEGIIMESYPDHYNLFDKQDWIRSVLDPKTSELVRKFYLIC